MAVEAHQDESDHSLQTIIFTGVSGGGKTTALRAVEDLGFYCVDNLPLPLLGGLGELVSRMPGVDRLGLVIDARRPEYIDSYETATATLRRLGHSVELVFLDARDDVLLRRFSQTRRRHPLAHADVVAGLAEERRLLAPLAAHATTSMDTSELTLHQLKKLIQDRYQQRVGLVVNVLSFGFRYGIPSYADLLFDVRFLTNPFFVEHLRPLSGRDSAVAEYVLSNKDATDFLDHTHRLFSFLLPRYQAEGKAYLTIAIGCTGGRHRSVALTEALGKRFESEERPVNIQHRDIDR